VARSGTGWCDLLNPAAGVVLPQPFEPPLPRSAAAGFPSLSKEGNFSVEFRDRN
jgi:hypothetical protein